MEKDFSIEASIEKIYNSKTKDYFIEVYQTFVNGNYRSSTVMLYSVLICDLVFKLRDLRDLYNDSKAKKILEEIESIQIANPKSPDWETKLIEFIRDRLTLLEPSDIVTIESLQKYRHLSAHPVLTHSDLLYNPNKDTVRSLIRNILIGVLINPPFFSNKIFDTFVKDLSEIKDKITGSQGLKKYLTSRYLSRLKDTDFSKLFRSLWKIVFISEDIEADENRTINYEALKILFEQNEPLCLDCINSESNYYSNITKHSSLNNISLLVTSFPKVFNEFESSLKQLLTDHISQDDNLRLICWFLNESIEKHWEYLNSVELTNLQEKNVLLLRTLAENHSHLNEFIRFIIQYFVKSNSWETCQNRFDNALITITDIINKEQFKALLKESNKNSQIYNRIGMSQRLKNMMNSRFEDEIDETKYKNLFK